MPGTVASPGSHDCSFEPMPVRWASHIPADSRKGVDDRANTCLLFTILKVEGLADQVQWLIFCNSSTHQEAEAGVTTNPHTHKKIAR